MTIMIMEQEIHYIGVTVFCVKETQQEVPHGLVTMKIRMNL